MDDFLIGPQSDEYIPEWYDEERSSENADNFLF